MLNLLWCVMLLAGIIYGAFNGTMPEVTEAALDSAREAVSLCVSIAGVVAFWNGLMRIAEETGMVQAAAHRLRPFLVWLMPGLKGQARALEYISTNMIANVLGLGWAATPAGLKAMEELGRLEEKRRDEDWPPAGKSAPDTAGQGVRPRHPEAEKKAVFGRTASNEMCTFLIINISSLQLIPVNIIAYRSQYGSVNPTAIVGPGIVATAVSTIVAVVFCKMMDGKRKK